MNPSIYRQLDAPFVRIGTESVKWDLLGQFGNPDALPMWIADMDFPTAPGIIEGLMARTAHGAFGYTLGEDRDKQATADWFKTRHALDISPEDIHFCPGVVDALYHVLKALFVPGSRIVVQPPVYKPFYDMAKKAGMKVLENPLMQTESGWKMDPDGLEEIFRQGADGLILCSPHNPVGRVWTRRELADLADLCARYGVRIISDEIHADFELKGAVHTCILSLPRASSAVQLVSATKTFNLAALRHSAIFCRDRHTAALIESRLAEVMTDVNLYGRLATRLAYETGAEWLDTLLEYLTEGRDLLENGINETGVLKASHSEGTYLCWVDCRALGMENDALKEWFIKTAGIVPNEGTFFGQAGNGFVRLNFATRHDNIREAVRRIQEAVKNK